MLLVTTFINATLSLFLSTGDINAPKEDNAARGEAIMTEVFHRFHINYEMSRVHKLGYYQEAMEDTDGIHYLAESIVDIFVPHNLSQETHASIMPIKARKKVFEEITPEDMLFGNASDMARCSIWRPKSFLSEKNRNNYVFNYVDDTVFKNFQVSVIKFKPANSKGVVSGTILVDKSSYAIVHIDYTPDTSGSKLWNKVTWTEEWYFTEGKFELSKVKFEGLCSKNQYEYSATLVMQHLRVLAEIPDHYDYIDKDGSLFDHAGDDFTENFWTGFQELKHDVDEEHVVHLATN